MTLPLCCQSPYLVGSRPLTPPISFSFGKFSSSYILLSFL
ncbi:hypothetical protein REIS_2061 [Rickettsia endosymbiont of Ixodes scapularis]|nr:hypothetical protein REIS_2061 [Rickettsia endosymbiont of Ixodes scapularis]